MMYVLQFTVSKYICMYVKSNGQELHSAMKGFVTVPVDSR